MTLEGSKTAAPVVLQTGVNLNQDITDKLERMAKIYQLSRETKDAFRVMSYQRIAGVIKKLPYRIKSPEEVQQLAARTRGIGGRMAEHIMEIVKTGNYAKLDQANQDGRNQTLMLFTKVLSVGASLAEKFYRDGCRTLEDISKRPDLSRANRIGLQYFDELQQRIPRSEVAEIEVGYWSETYSP